MSTSLTLSEHAKQALLPILKADLDITDKQDDIKLLESIALTAETFVGDISEVSNEEEILADTKLLSLAEETIRNYVMYRYKRRNNNNEAAKDYKDDYKHTLLSFKKKARNLMTDRTKRVLVAKDPRDAKVVLPTQTGIFSFDDFA
mgnify:CR=1 FL=1